MLHSDLSSARHADWWSKAAAVGVGAGVAASVVFWGLQLATPLLLPVMAAPISMADSPQDAGASVARALGHTAPSVKQEISASSQYKLLGVISSVSGQGSALIATDGQLPKAYRVGQTVQEDWTLKSLSATKALLKSSSQQIELVLPELDKR